MQTCIIYPLNGKYRGKMIQLQLALLYCISRLWLNRCAPFYRGVELPWIVGTSLMQIQRNALEQGHVSRAYSMEELREICALSCVLYINIQSIYYLYESSCIISPHFLSVVESLSLSPLVTKLVKRKLCKANTEI